jgi:hypothetical protein
MPGAVGPVSFRGASVVAGVGSAPDSGTLAVGWLYSFAGATGEESTTGGTAVAGGLSTSGGVVGSVITVGAGDARGVKSSAQAEGATASQNPTMHRQRDTLTRRRPPRASKYKGEYTSVPGISRTCSRALRSCAL